MRGVRATLGLVVLALVLALAVLLVIQNFQTIRVRLFRAEFELRLGWALLIAAVVGAGLSSLLSRLGRLFVRR